MRGIRDSGTSRRISLSLSAGNFLLLKGIQCRLENLLA